MGLQGKYSVMAQLGRFTLAHDHPVEPDPVADFIHRLLSSGPAISRSSRPRPLFLLVEDNSSDNNAQRAVVAADYLPTTGGRPVRSRNGSSRSHSSHLPSRETWRVPLVRPPYRPDQPLPALDGSKQVTWSVFYRASTPSLPYLRARRPSITHPSLRQVLVR